MSLPETIALADGFVLERARPEHAREMAEAVGASLDHLRPYLPWPSPEQATEAKQRERLERLQDVWQRSEHFSYVIRRGEDPEVLGNIGLDWTSGGPDIEIGYWVRAEWCNRGLATRASRALTAAAFDIVEIERVVIRCDVTNTASAAIPRKLGFTLDRTVDSRIEAPSESGREMVWKRERTSEDAVEFQTSPNRAVVRIGDTVRRPVER